MKAILLAGVATVLLSGAAIAQTTTTTPNASKSTGVTAEPVTPAPANKDAAAGNNNQAVATTSADSPTPAKGSNSFTDGEAKSRLENKGFSSVSDLKKDENGVWRGKADKNGASTDVWLDYKGNAGTGVAVPK